MREHTGPCTIRSMAQILCYDLARAEEAKDGKNCLRSRTFPLALACTNALKRAMIPEVLCQFCYETMRSLRHEMGEKQMGGCFCLQQAVCTFRRAEDKVAES